MKKLLILFLLIPVITSAISVSDFFNFGGKMLGAVRTFTSLQLADDPDNGECLTTDGTNNSWSSNCGSGGGGFDFPDVQSWGNATSTRLGFLNGFISSASSTINSNLNITGNATATNATTSNFHISSMFNFGGVVGNSWDDFCVSITGSADLCDGGDATGAGGAFPFTTETNFGDTANSTSTLVWFKDSPVSLAASSSSYFTGIFDQNWRVSTSTVVCAVGCQYSSIQSAITAGWNDIYLKNGVYSEQITLSAAKTTIIGESQDAILQCNGITQSPCISTGGADQYVFENFAVRETNGQVNGIGIDFSNSALGRINNVRITNFATSTYAHDTANETFYNDIENNTFFNTGTCLDLGWSQANANHSRGNRCRPMALTGTTTFGFFLADARGFTSVGDDIEGTTTGASTIGIYVGTTTRETSFTNPWVEALTTGVLVDSGANRTTFTGGSITSNGTDITDNGTNTVFLNTSDTGVLTTRLGHATSTSFSITTLTSALLQTDASGNVQEYAGTTCTNQFVRVLSALGVATCESVGNEDFEDDDWGDITISSNVASVEDDSHAHTGATLSGIDISGDTNLTAGDNLTLTDDDLDLDTTLTGLLKITTQYASTTDYASFFTASSTNWTGGGLTDCDADEQTVSYDATTQKFGCGDDDNSGGASIGKTFELVSGGDFLFATSSPLKSLGVGASTTASLDKSALFQVNATGTTGILIKASSTASFAGDFMKFVNSGGIELFKVNSSGGLTSFASSTIGGGTNVTGLTVAGTATTTDLKVTSLTASRAVFTAADGLLTTTGTVGNLESSVGSQNILLETEIDGCSELAALLDAETGGCNGTSGPVFPDSPTFSTSAIFPLGNVGAPGLTFTSDTNNGIWSAGSDILNFSTGGIERARFTSGCGFLVGTTTDGCIGNMTLSSSTASQLILSSGADFAQWSLRNAGGNLYLSTTTVAGTATSTPAGLTINGSAGSKGLFVGTTTNSGVTGLAVEGTIVFGSLTQATGGTNNDLCISSANNLVEETTGTCIVSSRRFKHDISKLKIDSESIIRALSPSSFIVNGREEEGLQYGFIAEEAFEADIHLANLKDDMPYNLDDHGFLAILWDAVKKLFQKNDEQDVRLDQLEKENAELRARLDKLENEQPQN